MFELRQRGKLFGRNRRGSTAVRLHPEGRPPQEQCAQLLSIIEADIDYALDLLLAGVRPLSPFHHYLLYVVRQRRESLLAEAKAEADFRAHHQYGTATSGWAQLYRQAAALHLREIQQHLQEKP